MESGEIAKRKELHRIRWKPQAIHRHLAEIDEHPEKWMGKSIRNYTEIYKINRNRWGLNGDQLAPKGIQGHQTESYANPKEPIGGGQKSRDIYRNPNELYRSRWKSKENHEKSNGNMSKPEAIPSSWIREAFVKPLARRPLTARNACPTHRVSNNLQHLSTPLLPNCSSLSRPLGKPQDATLDQPFAAKLQQIVSLLSPAHHVSHNARLLSTLCCQTATHSIIMEWPAHQVTESCS